MDTVEDVFKEDFGVSFALLMHLDASIDFWNATEPVHWRGLFRGGGHYRHYRAPFIYVDRPTNKIGYIIHTDYSDIELGLEVGESSPFPDGIWT